MCGCWWASRGEGTLGRVRLALLALRPACTPVCAARPPGPWPFVDASSPLCCHWPPSGRSVLERWRVSSPADVPAGPACRREEVDAGILRVASARAAGDLMAEWDPSLALSHRSILPRSEIPARLLPRLLRFWPLPHASAMLRGMWRMAAAFSQLSALPGRRRTGVRAPPCSSFLRLERPPPSPRLGLLPSFPSLRLPRETWPPSPGFFLPRRGP